MNFPYPIWGIITATDSSTPSTRATLRNDRTGESINVTSTTSGVYLIDAANFTNGYMTTDRVTVIVGYGAEEGTSSILISSETHEVNITLTAISESTDTNYCTIQDVLDELGDKTTDDISYERVRKIILRAESEIDDRTGTSFQSTTVTDEIYDVNQYTSYKSPERLFQYGSHNMSTTRTDHSGINLSDTIRLKKFPIISVTSLYTNRASAKSADDWIEITEQEGSAGDFIVTTDIGMIQFVGQIPAYGKRRVKVTYVYGYATTPKVVENLAILLSVRSVLISKGNKSQFSPVNLSVDGFSKSSGSGSTVSYLTWLNSEIKDLWKTVGEFVHSIV